MNKHTSEAAIFEWAAPDEADEQGEGSGEGADEATFLLCFVFQPEPSK